MRYLYALMGVLALILAASAALYSVELREDIFLDKDNASTSFSEEKTLWVTSIDGAPVREVYLGFKNNFKPDVVSKLQIASAQLQLYPIEVRQTGNIVAYFVKDETLPTWTWEYRNKITYNESVNATVYVDKDKGECIIDVTPIIREAVAACETGCDYSIKLVAEDNVSVGFASKESGEKMPRLEYTTA